MAMGKRRRERQPALWVAASDLPTAASHPFYRLNEVLAAHGDVPPAAGPMKPKWRTFDYESKRWMPSHSAF